jgi:hypothetical protein
MMSTHRGLLMLALVICSVTAIAQTKTYVVVKASQNVRSEDFQGTITKLTDFLLTESIRVQQQSTTQMNFSVDCNLTEQQYLKYRQVLTTCGYIASDNLSRVDNTVQVEQLQATVQFQKEQLEQQRSALEKMSTESEQYTTMWQSMHNMESAIRQNEREIASLTASEFYYAVDLNVYDETYTPQTSNVTFVNMPGVEYSYYRVEQPKDTISSPVYQGVFLKYVFTRGKSFATLGAYKSTAKQTNTADSLVNAPSAYTEFFAFGFGQDFYSKHLGRGNRKFLNLYTGYTIGGMLLSNDLKNKFSTYVAPSIGLELFKNKYVLIDTKLNYMVPFKDTRHVRGLAFNASFNFVF